MITPLPTTPDELPLPSIDDLTVTFDPVTVGELVPISLLLVDEHQMFTDALSRLLASEHDLLPIGAVGTVAEAVIECGRRSPDVILVDLRVPDMAGVAGIRSIRRASPRSAVVVVTDRDDPVAITAAIQAGARGFVLKTQAVDDLVVIIRQAAAGEIVISVSDVPGVIGRLQLARQRENEARRTFERLTARENQILALLAHGRSTTETAAALSISPLTVRSHVKSILAKLGVHSKLEAVTYALRNGLVEADRSA
jgi:DNA-binding NarL/FixJ family response regulator